MMVYHTAFGEDENGVVVTLEEMMKRLDHFFDGHDGGPELDIGYWDNPEHRANFLERLHSEGYGILECAVVVDLEKGLGIGD